MGSLVRFVSRVGATSGGSNGSHIFDLSARSNAGWKRASTGLSTILASDYYGTSVCWHGSLRKFIAFAAGLHGLPSTGVWYLDMENRPTKGVGLHGAWSVPTFTTMDSATSRYWPGHEVVILFGLNSATSAWALQYFDPYTPTRAPAYLSLTGPDVLPYPLLENVKWGFAYYPEGNCFFAKPPAQTRGGVDPYSQNLWSTPPLYNWRNRPWTVEKLTFGGDMLPPGKNESSISKRFGWNPKIGCLVWVGSTSTAVYAYRPPLRTDGRTL